MALGWVVYLPSEDAYRCLAGELLTRGFESVEGGLTAEHPFSTIKI